MQIFFVVAVYYISFSNFTLEFLKNNQVMVNFINRCWLDRPTESNPCLQYSIIVFILKITLCQVLYKYQIMIKIKIIIISNFTMCTTKKKRKKKGKISLATFHPPLFTFIYSPLCPFNQLLSMIIHFLNNVQSKSVSMLFTCILNLGFS